MAFGRGVVHLFAGYDRLSKKLNATLVHSNLAAQNSLNDAASCAAAAAAAAAAAGAGSGLILGAGAGAAASGGGGARADAGDGAASAPASAPAQGGGAAPSSVAETVAEALVRANDTVDDWARVRRFLQQQAENTPDRATVTRRSQRVQSFIYGDASEERLKGMRLAVKAAAATLRIGKADGDELMDLARRVVSDFYSLIELTPAS